MCFVLSSFFFFNDTATTEIYTLSLHDALPITAQTREQIIGRILALPEGTRFMVLAPVVRGQKGEFKDFFADMVRRGYVRARVDGQLVKMTDDLKLDKRIKHSIEIVVDRLKVD